MRWEVRHKWRRKSRLIFFNHIQSERQTRLREHARRLIAETRAKSINLDSPSSPVRSITQRITLSPERTISPINNNVNQFNYNTTMPGEENSREQSPGRTLSPRGKSPLQALNILDRISPKAEMKVRPASVMSLMTLKNLHWSICSLRRRSTSSLSSML